MATAIFASTGNPVVGALVFAGRVPIFEDVMNTTKRFVFGVLSSLLFSAGFVNAADRLDPMSQALPPSDSNTKMAATQDSGTFCHFTNEDR